MILVPTLQLMVDAWVATSFWGNHHDCQMALDRQGEPCLRIGRIDLPEGFGK